MRIIHTADQHLDSGLASHLPERIAIMRRAEIVKTFADLVDYAAHNSIEAILLSGDLFDTKVVASNVQRTVAGLINANPSITFFYLKGNHDNKSFLSSLDEMPDNLKLFDDDCKSYRLSDRIVVSGLELNENNSRSFSSKLNFRTEDINIFMLHCNIVFSQSSNWIDVNIKELADKNIDYLALGHIHTYKKDRIDGRGYYCYSGCLEGRGYDEAGKKGFVVLDINEENKTISSDFIPFARRNICKIQADITDSQSDVETEKIVEEVLYRNDVNSQDMVEVVLTGNINEEYIPDTIYLSKRFEDRFFCFKMKNSTDILIDYRKYANDISLKSEFVRTVLEDETLSEKEKNEIINVGFMALRKENLENYIIN